MTPEEVAAAARARAAARRDAGEALPAGGLVIERVSTLDTSRLIDDAVIEPDLSGIRSTRRLGAPITFLKRGMLRLLGQYHGQMQAQETLFNLHSAMLVRALERRIDELETRIASSKASGERPPGAVGARARSTRSRARRWRSASGSTRGAGAARTGRRRSPPACAGSGRSTSCGWPTATCADPLLGIRTAAEAPARAAQPQAAHQPQHHAVGVDVGPTTRWPRSSVSWGDGNCRSSSRHATSSPGCRSTTRMNSSVRPDALVVPLLLDLDRLGAPRSGLPRGRRSRCSSSGGSSPTSGRTT